MKPDTLDDAALSTAYQALETPTPPAALDAAILAAAREAVHAAAPSNVIAFPQKPRRNWTVPLSLAASLVLAVGVSWQMHDSGEVSVDAEAAMPAAAPAPSADSGGMAMEMAGAVPPLASSAPDAAPPAPPPKDVASSISSKPAERARSAAVAAPAPMAAPANTSEPTPLVIQESIAPPPAAAAPIMQLKSKKKEDAVTGSSPFAADAQAESVGGSGEVREFAKGLVAPAPASAPAAAPVADKPAAPAKQAAPALLKQMRNMPPPGSQPDASPEAAINTIRRLLAEDRPADAKLMLKRLREHWPDYPLPADIAKLAAEPATTSP